MAKVTGEKMTEAEKQNLKTWFCQDCGGELDEQRSDDPTRQVKCGACGQSWWATAEPEAADVKERTAAREASKKAAKK